MAQFALPLCLAFIFWALRQDHKESPQLSAALWIPFFWLFICASKPPSRWLNPAQAPREADFNYLQGSPVDRSFFVACMVVGLIILYRRRKRWAFPFSQNALIYVFYLYALMSVSWSAYPGIAMKRWVRTVGDIVMVLLILSEKDKEESAERIFRRCLIVLIPLSVLFIRFYRYIGVSFDQSGFMMWKGAANHKNGLGVLCAFGAVFLFWRILKLWPKINVVDAGLLLPIAYLMIGARSATSNVILVMGLLMVVFVRRFKSDVQKINAWIIAMMVSLFFFQAVLSGFFGKSFSAMFFSATGREQSFTGRMPLWTELIEIGSQRPLFGAGYGSFWLGDLTHNLWERFPWKPTNGHSGYIDVFIDLGIIGLIIVLMMVGRAYIKILGSIAGGKEISKLFLVFLVMIISHNLTETSFAMPTNMLWVLFLLLSATVLEKEGGLQVSGPSAEPS